jgi:DNA-binding MarR family transcriptional regulator
MEKCVMNQAKGTDPQFYNRIALIQDAPLAAREPGLLLALFRFADYKTNMAYPSVGRLSRASKLSESTVFRALKSLEGRGVITRMRGDVSSIGSGYIRRTNTYRINYKALAAFPSVASGVVVTVELKQRSRRPGQTWESWRDMESRKWLVKDGQLFNKQGHSPPPMLANRIVGCRVGDKVSMIIPAESNVVLGTPATAYNGSAPDLDLRMKVTRLRRASEEEQCFGRPINT